MRAIAVATFAALLALSLHTAAQPAPDPRASDLADRIASPFCPGRTLNECTSPSAAVWRRDIAVWVEEGVPSAEIERRLEARAGHDLETVPDAGVSIVMFLAIAAVAVSALVFAFRRVLRRSPGVSQRSADKAPAPQKNDEAYDRRLDDELAALDS